MKRKTKCKKLWICGQLKGKWKKSGSIWDFQGVFDSIEKADKACLYKSYFYFSANLNEELPRKSVYPPEACYPRFFSPKENVKNQINFREL